MVECWHAVFGDITIICCISWRVKRCGRNPILENTETDEMFIGVYLGSQNIRVGHAIVVRI